VASIRNQNQKSTLFFLLNTGFHYYHPSAAAATLRRSRIGGAVRVGAGTGDVGGKSHGDVHQGLGNSYIDSDGSVLSISGQQVDRVNKGVHN
jgi:hypothetical protein